ncbi:MAG TPA: cysteine desulfurase [Rhabdochlamydiaceae bacterium]|nr:cysteine desulfurase [Rhabdochlamydiaceae bacterium]
MKLLGNAVRKDFPIFKAKSLVYFDSAATTHKPASVIDALSNFYSQEYATVHRSVYELAAKATVRYNSVRAQIQEFLGAKLPEEIIFTRGTTDAINLLATTFGKVYLQEGDEILVSEMEHHSNIVPWQMLCKEKKAHLRVIPINESAEILLDEYKKLLTPRTKLVSIAHIGNATGTINPVKQMIELAHEVGAKVLVDGAQAVSHLEFNVQDLNADFYAFSGHKAFGPTGIGVLYGKHELLESLPPYQGGSDMIEEVGFDETTFQRPPLKFEAGTPMIAQVMGLGEAITYIEKLGRKQIAEWEHKLLEYTTQQLLKIPKLRIIGTAKEKAAIISFVIEGIHPLDLGTLLDLHGIAVRTGHHCAQPLMKRFKIPGTTRISFAPYNTFEEIDFFIDKLKRILPRLV